ncbi:Pycsar system effector family protein [Streptomyces xantholiticus]|uniref:Pycsar system effector family protein n=1 Tax=Streptomyces xantholiticus TaxID=68285 RepID=A0ABV1UYY6_9ACTN
MSAGTAPGPDPGAAPARPGAPPGPDPGTAPGPEPGPSGPGAGSDVRFVAERLLNSVREDIGRADAKAAILLSGAVAALAVAFSRNELPLPAAGPAAAVVTAGLLLCAAGVLMLVGVILPRTRTGADTTFLRDLSVGTPADEILARIRESGEDVVRWLVGQAQVHGAVLAAKYRWLRMGVCSLTLGALLVLFGELW